MARVKFLNDQSKDFFDKVQNRTGLSFQGLADICKVHRRSFSDWKYGECLMPLLVFEKLVKISGLYPPVIKILPESWHIREAGRKGAIARNKIYGNPGTPEGRSKGGKTTCQKLHSNPEFAKETGFLVRKEINYPQRSSRLAELIGVLLGDGGIQDYQVVVSLNKETDKKYIPYVVKLFKDLFHVGSIISEEKDGNTCGVVVSSRNLVEYLIKVGLKKGNKIEQQVDIPDWILEEKKLKLACLRGLIDTDGCFYVDVHEIKNKYYFNPGLAFTTHSLPLFLSVKEILRDFDYHPTGENRNIFLRRKNEIIKYFKEVKPSNPKHVLRFENFLRAHRN